MAWGLWLGVTIAAGAVLWSITERTGGSLRSHPSADARRSAEIVIFAAPIAWIVLSFGAGGLAARWLRRAAKRRQAIVLSILATLFTLAVGLVWLGFSLLSTQLSRIGPL